MLAYLLAAALVVTQPLNNVGFTNVSSAAGGGGAGNGDLNLDADCLDWPTRGRLCALVDGQWYFVDEAGAVTTSVLLDTVTTPNMVEIKQSDLTALDVNTTGSLYSNNNVWAGGTVGWSGASRMGGTVNGVITLYNNALTDFISLNLGGITTSFPSIRRIGSILGVMLADGSAYSKIRAGEIELNSTGEVLFNARAKLKSTADGVFTLYNNAENNFTSLNFGGTTSSFPSWQRNGSSLEAKVADGSAFTKVRAEDLELDSTGRLTFNARLKIDATADGNMLLRNNALSSFNLLQLGGSTSSYPAVKRRGTILDVKLADDSAYTQVRSGSLEVDAAGTIGFDTRARLKSDSTNDLVLTNDLENNFDELKFGGTTSSFPSIQRSGTLLRLVLAGTGTRTDLELENINVNSTAELQFNLRSKVEAPGTGRLTLLDWAGTNFTILQFGGTTTSYPGLARDGTALEVRNAANSDWAPLETGALTHHKGLRRTAIIRYNDANMPSNLNYYVYIQETSTGTKLFIPDDDHCLDGQEFLVINQTGNKLDIDPEGTSTISGGSTYRIDEEEGVTVMCTDGSGGAGAKEWYVVNNG